MPDGLVPDWIRLLFPEALHPQLWLVGGSVRDLLQGITPHDLDLVSSLSEQEFQPLGFKMVRGKSTAPILFKNQPDGFKLEITLLAAGQRVEEELMRRDFRSNAIAVSFHGVTIDPAGGLQDVNARQLLPCSGHSCSDDPIRIFRAFRFACHGWNISPELAQQINSRSWEQQLKQIPVERFSREMLKAMTGERPDRFFVLMAEYGVGGCYLPELFKMQQIPAGPARYHGDDTVLKHSLAVLRRLSERIPEPIPRLAAFFHDLGKLETPEDLLPRHIGHDRTGVEKIRQLARRLRLSTTTEKALAAASGLHMNAARWNEMRDIKKLALTEKAYKAGASDWLPYLVSADHGTDGQMLHWNIFNRVVASPATALGIEPAWLESATPAERIQRIAEARLDLLHKEQALLPEADLKEKYGADPSSTIQIISEGKRPHTATSKHLGLSIRNLSHKSRMN